MKVAIWFLTLLALTTSLDGAYTPNNTGGKAFAVEYYGNSAWIPQDYKIHLDMAAEAVKHGMKNGDCAIIGKSVPCIKSEHFKIAITPFTSAIGENGSSIDFDGTKDEYYETMWAPATVTFGGEKAISKWKKYADSGESLACSDNGGRCTVIVHTLDKGLARCEVERFKTGVMGAPNWCNHIALMVNGKWFIEVIKDYTAMPIPRPRGRGSQDFSLKVFSNVVRDKFQINSSLTRVLAVWPLNLSTEIRPSGDILGVGSYRASNVLKGWREIVTIRLQVYTATGPEAHRQYERYSNKTSSFKVTQFIGIEVISTLYVNKQNSAQPNDWTLPSEAQENLWVETLKSNVKREVQKICKAPRWVDGVVLECR